MSQVNQAPDHSILITGATGDVGSAVARLLSSRRAKLYLTARKPEAEVEQLLSEIATLGADEVHYFQCDFESGFEATNRLVTDVAQRSGKTLSAVIGTHGIYEKGKDFSETDRIRMHKVNAFSYANLSEALEKAVARDSLIRGLSVLYLSSIAGHRSRSGDNEYSMSKGALNAHIRTFATFETNGLYLNGVAPGPIKGKVTEGRGYPDDQLLLPSEVAQFIIECLEGKFVEQRGIISEIKRVDGMITPALLRH